MAQHKKATNEVDNVLPYLEGVAKSLVDRLYGPAGPAWVTTFSELEETVAAGRKALTAKMLDQALARQAGQTERPPEYNVCPGCGRPTTAGIPPQPRRLATGAGEARWQEPKTRCDTCRRDFFPQRKSLGLDRSQYSPSLQRQIVYAGAAHGSFEQGQQSLRELAGVKVSAKQVERLTRAFVGDGSDNNGAIWRRFFSSWTALIDFMHVLSYLFAAATAGRTFAEGWPVYVRWIEWLWQGQPERVIVALARRQVERGAPEAADGETSPRRLVADALTYLQNHKDKMGYHEYRRQGWPLTSSHMESVMKQLNQRVKGTEKFWCEEGAEAMLQLRADQLSDARPLDAF